MKKVIFAITIIISCLATSVIAQDILTKRNKETLQVKITEIGIDEIKYQLFEQPQSIVYTIDKAEVDNIKLANGRIEKFEINTLFPVAVNEQHKQAIKVNFLIPLTSSVKLSYEKLVKPSASFEVTATMIGVSKSILDNQQRGLGLSVGYKMFKHPDYYARGIRPRHSLNGLYMMPTIHVGAFRDEVADWSLYEKNLVNRNVTYAAALLHLGNQWVFNNRIMIDFNLGLGVGASNAPEKQLYMDGGNYYGVRNILQSGIFGTSTLKVGYLF